MTQELENKGDTPFLEEESNRVKGGNGSGEGWDETIREGQLSRKELFRCRP